jgi:DNA-binding MarR family transcriptional regulator
VLAPAQLGPLRLRNGVTDDRRKNTLSLTSQGRDAMRSGAGLIGDCERRFLARLSGPDAEQLKKRPVRSVP